MSEQKNFIITIALVALILLGWQFLWPSHKPVEPATQAGAAQLNKDAPAPSGSSPTPALPPENRLISLLSAPRVKVQTKDMKGSITLTGARIDDISLTRYH